jgi:hypothetical protein
MTDDRRYVLVTTEYRGVFFGSLESETGRTVVLADARCAISWETTGGFIELAQSGPNTRSLIGDIAPRIKLHGVTSIVDCTEAAAAAWRLR